MAGEPRSDRPRAPSVAELDAQLAQLARARNMLGLLAEAAGEALRLVRLPR